MFYGIIVSLCSGKENHRSHPHLHARFPYPEAVFSILDGEVLAGGPSPKKNMLVQAWITLHEKVLTTDRKLATGEKHVFKVEPLR